MEGDGGRRLYEQILPSIWSVNLYIYSSSEGNFAIAIAIVVVIDYKGSLIAVLMFHRNPAPRASSQYRPGLIAWHGPLTSPPSQGMNPYSRAFVQGSRYGESHPLRLGEITRERGRLRSSRATFRYSDRFHS
jgi:hypothetical protein